MANSWIRNDLRLAIYIRDRFTCQHCEKSLSNDDITLSLDHIVPRSNNGPNDHNNLVTLCRSCNSTKGAMEPERFFSNNYEFIMIQANKDITPLRKTAKILLKSHKLSDILSKVSGKESL